MGALKVLESDSMTIQNQIILNISIASRMFYIHRLFVVPLIPLLPLFINIKYLFKGVQYLMLPLLRLLLKTFSWKTNFLHHLLVSSDTFELFFYAPKTVRKKKWGEKKRLLSGLHSSYTCHQPLFSPKLGTLGSCKKSFWTCLEAIARWTVSTSLFLQFIFRQRRCVCATAPDAELGLLRKNLMSENYMKF